MSEINPDNFTIHFETGEHLRCTPDNCTLYVHSEDWKEVDHIYRASDDEELRLEGIGTFVWRSILGEEGFNDLGMFMKRTMKYPMIYRPEPTLSDRQHYIEYQFLNMLNKGDVDGGGR